jgi:hypothetical protein
MNDRLPRTPDNGTSKLLVVDKPTAEREPFVIGALGGLLSGLLGAFFFTRAAREIPVSQRQPIKTTQLFSIALAVLTLMRQIAELNKPEKPDKRGWRGK